MTRTFTESPPIGSLTLERLPAVKARTAMSRSEIYRRIALGDFPRPIKLGSRSSAWVADEVSAFIASRIALRDQGAKR